MPRRPVTSMLALFLVAAGCSSSLSETPTSRSSTSSGSESARAHRPAPTATARATVRADSVSRATCGESGRLVRFRVAVEDDLPTTPALFAAAVRRTLCDERSWTSGGDVRFRYDPSGPLLISLRSPAGTERRCMQLIGLSVNQTYSCGTSREVVLNSARWFGGSPSWPGPVSEYRQMLTNHETGHALGLGHQTCRTDGAPAPVMMQQSKGLTTGSRTCVRNPWPLAEELDRLG